MSKNYKIIRYKNFINENISYEITTKEKDLLKEYDIKDYKFNEDTNLIDVYKIVKISSKYLYSDKVSHLPNIRFGKINGSFDCSDNTLTTLKNSPKEVNGTFYCNDNKLTSLEFCTHKVTNSFNCSNNELTSLEGCPTELNNNFYCTNNKLTSLEHCPRYIGGFFDCGDNKNISYIEDYPRCIIKGDISKIHHFEKIHKIVKENEEIFIHLLDDKIKFHQMVMRLDSSLIKYYRTISPPSKNSKLLL